jgi:hypothetical protein
MKSRRTKRYSDLVAKRSRQWAKLSPAAQLVLLMRYRKRGI